MKNTSNKSNSKWNLKNDVYFKEFFSKKENEKFLVDFLTCLLKKEIKSLKVRKDYALRKENVKLKTGILDIKAKLEDGSTIILEMQVRNRHNIPERMTYYNAKALAMQLKRGDDYIKLNPVISIMILDFNLYNCSRYLSTSTIIQEDKIVMVDKIKFQVIELPKIRKEKPDYQNGIYCWLMFIDGKNKEVIKMIKKARPIFKEAEEELEKLYGDSELEAIAESREKWEWDMHSLKQYTMEQGKKIGLEKGMKQGIEQGIKQGIEQGMKQGKKEEKMKIVKSMMIHGFDLKTIAAVTKLTIKEIKGLQEKFS